MSATSLLKVPDEKLAGSLQRVVGLRQRGCLNVPDVQHLRPDLKVRLTPSRAYLSVNFKRVVEKYFASNMDEQWRKTVHVGEQGRDARIFQIMVASVSLDHLSHRIYVDHWVAVGQLR